MERGIAIVTGARARVGATIAEALVADGWQVAGVVRSESDALPDGVQRVVADLGDPQVGKKVLAAIGEEPTLLVNNAARFEEDMLGSLSAAELDAHMHVNVRAPALIAEAMVAAGNAGLIVNILDAKLAAPNPDYLSYTLSKAALAAWTDIAARGWAEQGVRVNAIAPATMLPSGDMSAEQFAAVHDLNPLGHGVDMEEVVAALRYFIDAPGVTGETITIDGGQRFLLLPRDVAYLEVDE